MHLLLCIIAFFTLANGQTTTGAQDRKVVTFYESCVGSSITANIDNVTSVEAVGKPKTAFVTPGIQATCVSSPHIVNLVNTLKGQFDCVICMDWSAYAADNTLDNADKNAPDIGAIMGRYINESVACGTDLSQSTAFCHSIGCLIIGFAVGTLRPDQFAVITGIEPFGRCSMDGYPLNTKSAKYVEIYKSSIVSCSKEIGHVTYYIDGGNQQCFCEGYTLVQLTQLITCQHVNATKVVDFARQGMPLEAQTCLSPTVAVGCRASGCFIEQSKCTGSYNVPCKGKYK